MSTATGPELRPAVTSGWGAGGDRYQQAWGTFWGDGNVLHPHHGGSYLTVYLCQDSQICMLKG